RNGWIDFLLFGFIGAAWFLKLGSRKRALQISVVALIIVCGVVYLVRPIKGMSEKRIEDLWSIQQRAVNWRAGFQTIAAYPFSPPGWYSYYTHSTLIHPKTPLEGLTDQFALPRQTHSVFLDMAETAGIPLSVAFL